MKRTTAPNSVGGLHVDRIAGVQAGTRGIAEDRNNLQEELANLIESVGWSLDGTDQYQTRRSVIARSHVIGEIVKTEIKLTPVTLAGSKSTTTPSNPDYLPVIPRHDADHDVTTAQAPDLVTAYRAFAAEVVGSASFTATVSGSVLTFTSTTANNALLAALLADALVQRWFTSGQSATYAASGADYSNWRCINVAGTDYAITAVDIVARTITVSGSPSTGSQTVIFYPYRIAGSATSVRLHRLSGMVESVGQDSDGIEIAGLRHMDYAQGHWHVGGLRSDVTTGGTSVVATRDAIDTSVSPDAVAKDAITDGTNGAPRTGKATTPRSASRYAYSWAGRLLATV